MKEFARLLKKLIVLSALVALFFSPVLYFNICIDPYGIFRSDFTKQRIEPNSHFIKLRHLLYHETEFDSFIFGSSRANNIDNTKIPGGNYFNLYYSLGIPKEHLADLRRMISNGAKIRNVLITLDFVSYSAGDWGRESDPLRRPYPESGWELFKFYTNYTFQIPQSDFRKTLLSTPTNTIYKNILVTGRAVNDSIERYIETHRAAHVADDKFNYPSIIGHGDLVEETIHTLREIKQLCKDHDIQLRLAINPVHKVTYLGNDVAMHHRFLKELAEVSDYYDFGGINRVTSNNYFYYEPAHYRPLIGDAMVDFIYRNKRIDSIQEFGFHVTRENIDAHISRLAAELQNNH